MRGKAQPVWNVYVARWRTWEPGREDTIELHPDGETARAHAESHAEFGYVAEPLPWPLEDDVCPGVSRGECPRCSGWLRAVVDDAALAAAKGAPIRGHRPDLILGCPTCGYSVQAHHQRRIRSL